MTTITEMHAGRAPKGTRGVPTTITAVTAVLNKNNERIGHVTHLDLTTFVYKLADNTSATAARVVIEMEPSQLALLGYSVPSAVEVGVGLLTPSA